MCVYYVYLNSPGSPGVVHNLKQQLLYFKSKVCLNMISVLMIT